jgi:hypothetical protein
MIVKNIVKPFFMNNHQLNICHNLLIITHNIVGECLWNILILLLKQFYFI